MSKLYVVGTPIGNREDLSHRAQRILGEVDLIACEDTRVTKRLLENYSIYTPLVSYHAQSSETKEQYICDLLLKGKDIALVSDAGTPTISDPGTKLVARVHTLGQEVEILTLPGPSAGVALLSISGLPTHPHIFYGFLPHKKGRSSIIDEMIANEYTSIIYESPHRFIKFLESCIEKGVGDRMIAVGRELTKMHEQLLRDRLEVVHQYFVEHPEKVKGEFVIAMAGTKNKVY
jgi:16S rRNA (cytidine1402-2'-O)-methyltransferase